MHVQKHYAGEIYILFKSNARTRRPIEKRMSTLYGTRELHQKETSVSILHATMNVDWSKTRAV